jgi:hypothetical protein
VGIAAVPIRHLLEAEQAAFRPDDVRSIVQAFEEILRAKRMVDRTDPMVLMLAKVTIEMARKGERDPARLCEAVLKQMSV